MKKLKSFGSIATIVLLCFFIFVKCERIDQGHVGIKAKLSGTDKGVQDITEVSGWVFYNRWAYSVYEFPTFVQHKEYTGDQSFIVNSKDGSEFPVSPILNYHVASDKVVSIFKKYRRELEDVENGFIKTAVYDAFRMAANSFNADSLVSNRALFEKTVRKLLEDQILKEGFVVDQFTSNLQYPKTFKDAIDAKNMAVQNAMKVENQVRQAKAQSEINIVNTEASAKIRVMNAEATANATLIEAKAEAEANRLKSQSITPMLIQMKLAETWRGDLPTYGQVPTLFKDISK